jgi:uncharacterized protein YjiS (DUF1127 family)
MTSQKFGIGAPYGAAQGPLTSSLTGSLLNFVGRIATDLVRYRSFRKAEHELHALDDRMLKDIGIDRSEITSVLSTAAQQRRNTWRT